MHTLFKNLTMVILQQRSKSYLNLFKLLKFAHMGIKLKHTDNIICACWTMLSFHNADYVTFVHPALNMLGIFITI